MVGSPPPGEQDEAARLRDEVSTLEHELEEERVAHPLELFFDLVYVFAFTQVVSFVVHHLDVGGVLQGALILALLWWSWGTWTWSLNAVDVTPRVVRIALLAAMAGIFIMGFSVPEAFADGAWWFAGGYVWSRLIAAVVMVLGTKDDAVEQASLRRFLPISFIAPVLVLLGAGIGGDAQPWIWLVAAAVEVTSALLSGDSDWHIDINHFAERHGLIIIIALGEAIIAVGVALEEFELSSALAIRLVVGLAGASAMWWAYFDRLQQVWENALRAADEHSLGRAARDIYSLAHYPMIVGIVFAAVALEEAFLHPDEPMKGVVATLFAVSFGLFILGTVVATFRSHGNILYERIIGAVLIAAITAFSGMNAEYVVLVSTAVIIASLAVEYIRMRDVIRQFGVTH